MPEELGTRDVLEQVDIRLGNVEQDMRELRSEMNARFDRVYQELSGMRAEIRDLCRSLDQRFMWHYGLLVALVIGVAGLWFR